MHRAGVCWNVGQRLRPLLLVNLVLRASIVREFRQVSGGEVGSRTSRSTSGWCETFPRKIWTYRATGADRGEVGRGARAGAVKGVHGGTEEFLLVVVVCAVGDVLRNAGW